MEENKVVREIPEFLKEAQLTKPDEAAKHHNKLMEIANGFDEQDAAYVCRIFARKFPDTMFNALKTEMLDLGALKDDVAKTITLYSAKEEAI